MKLVRTSFYKADVSDPMFGASITLFLGPLDALSEELRAIEPALDGYRGRPSGGKAIIHDAEDGRRAWIIWLPWFNRDSSLPAVVHEVMHVTIDVLRHRGVDLAEGGESDEAYTYFAERLFERITNALFTHNEKDHQLSADARKRVRKTALLRVRK